MLRNLWVTPLHQICRGVPLGKFRRLTVGFSGLGVELNRLGFSLILATQGSLIGVLLAPPEQREEK